MYITKTKIMYETLKKIIKNNVPNNFIQENELFIRKIYAVFYSGTRKQCNICNKKLSCFVHNYRKELLCPNCGSLARDRRLWQIITNEYLKEKTTVLDFSPSRSLSRKWKKIPNINYNSTDFSGEFKADFKYDITNLKIESNTFDLICCYHILEHIEADYKAMDELFRVLKPKGILIIQTPFKEGDVYENPLITSKKDRLTHFEQEDHVRIYSEIELKKRLQKAGFIVEIRHFNENIENYFGFAQKETIFVISKP